MKLFAAGRAPYFIYLLKRVGVKFFFALRDGILINARYGRAHALKKNRLGSQQRLFLGILLWAMMLIRWNVTMSSPLIFISITLPLSTF